MKNNLSPHVTIYKFPIAALTSITTRLTGLYLSGVFVGVGNCLLFTNINIKEKYNILSNNYKKALNYSIIFPFQYHLLSGIRHTIWDKNPSLLTNIKVTKSSYFLFGTSILSTYIFEKYIDIINII